MTRITSFFGGLLLISGCGDKDTDPTATDADGDGVVAAEDCDDSDASALPGGEEVCDGVDNDCDGEIDNDPSDGSAFYVDADGDGHGSLEEVVACEAGEGVAAGSGDCDDGSAAANPDAAEVCDAVDNNCDGVVDEGLTETWYLDLDGDGYGTPDTTKEACSAPASYVDNADDCDDRSADISPDNLWYPDGDGDGFGSDTDVVAACLAPSGYLDVGGDCDDDEAEAFPGAAADVDPSLCSIDADHDGFGDSSATGDLAAGGDCDDSDAAIYPGAVAEAPSLCMIDEDGDGFGEASPPDGIDAGTDCIDRDSTIHPDAEEVCDGRDNNCDGVTDDDATDRITLYYDGDGDSYGDDSVTSLACRAVSPYVVPGGDCDDADNNISPGEYEDCTDGVDNNCDGQIDEACTYSSADASAEILGTSGSALLGSGVASASGDIDGDGVVDLLLGSQVSAGTGGSRTYGQGFVFFGPISSGSSLTQSDADLTITGSGSDYLSSSGHLGGDYDDDGYDDIALGAPYGSSYRGVVYVFSGPLTAGSLTSSDADATISPASGSGYLGQHLTLAGDVDDDGGVELIAGAPYLGSSGTYGAGKLLIFDDPSGTLSDSDAVAAISGLTSYEYVGTSAALPGDVDGDGYDDLIYGSYGTSEAYLLAGPITADKDSGDAIATFSSSASYSYTGSSVAGGDLDGDGYADLVVAAFGMSSYTGSVQIFYGPVSGALAMSSDEDASIEGAGSYHNLGDLGDVMSVRDIDGDGSDDLLLGNPGYSSRSYSYDGGLFTFYGPLSGAAVTTDADVAMYGSSGSYLGQSVEAADLDDDGEADIIGGAPYTGRSSSGAAFLLFSDDL